MLYKIFNEIHTALINKEIVKANFLLEELEELEEQEGLPYASKQLYDKFIQQLESTDIYQKACLKKTPVRLEGMLSQYDDRKLIPGISIVSCCMNRNENLVKACKTWLKLNVDEIIIVDWSSNTPVADTLEAINDERIKILRVDGEKKWILTYGFNIGLRFASYKTIYKIDADIEVSSNFLSVNRVKQNELIRGCWKAALENKKPNQIYVNGSFGCHKKHLLEIGFYNEFIRTYGWDDSDLYERLTANSGLGQKYLDFNSILHMEQKSSDRIINQDVIKDLFLGEIEPTEFNNQRNKCLVRLKDYWGKHLLQDYQISKDIKNNIWNLKRISQDINIASHIIDDANTYSSLLWLENTHPLWFSQSSKPKLLGKVFFNEYNKGVPHQITASILGLEHADIHIFDLHIKSLNRFIERLLKTSTKNKKIVLIAGTKPLYKEIVINNCSIHIKVDSLSSLQEITELRDNIPSTPSTGNIEIKKPPSSLIDDISIRNELARFESISKKNLYIDAQHGIGNRLRTIASAAVIAKKMDRNLVIIWEPDHHCECLFSDLFDYNNLVIDKSFLGEAEKNGYDIYNYMEIENDSEKDKEINTSKNDIYIRSAYSLNSPLTEWTDENNFIQSLTPVKEIMKMIDSFDLNNTIAAHVRMEAGEGTDHNTYDSIENWTQEGHDQLYFWREKSHYLHFIKRINELINENPDKKIFLATDMPETYKVFQEYYGDRLVFLSRDVYDRSKEQIIYGLADAILLSKCESILGSTWSSFTELALRLSKTYSSIEMSGKDF